MIEEGAELGASDRAFPVTLAVESRRYVLAVVRNELNISTRYLSDLDEHLFLLLRLHDGVLADERLEQLEEFAVGSTEVFVYLELIFSAVAVVEVDHQPLQVLAVRNEEWLG